MGIEDMYARRTSSNNFNGYDKNYKPPKAKKTKFKVGDEVFVQGEEDKVNYLKGKIISLAQDMHIEATILKYSDYIRYPKGMKDVFIMGRDGKRNLNGMDFKVVLKDKI